MSRVRGVLVALLALPRRIAAWLGRRAAGLARTLASAPRRLWRWLVALPGRVLRFVLSLPGRIWRVLVRTKRVLIGADPGLDEATFALALLAAVSGVVVTFLFANDLTTYPLVAAVGLVALGWARYQARTAKILTAVATAGTVLTLGFITYFLFEQAWGPLETYGRELLAIPRSEIGEPTERWFFGLDAILPHSEIPKGWDPNNEHYSLLAPLWATVVVTVIAGMVSGPLGILGALFIAEIASPQLRAIIKPAIEVLAGIPSIVYGFIGFQLLNSFVQDAFLDPGASFLIAGLVVGVMALPTTVSVAEDALSAVPSSMRDGSIAMGATEWQTMKSISIPGAISGISAAVILGLGRAIGETMAVAAIMASGTTFAFPLHDVFDQSVTLTSRIATTYGSASEATIEVLFVAGVMLFVIVAGASVLAKYIERRMNRKFQGQA